MDDTPSAPAPEPGADGGTDLPESAGETGSPAPDGQAPVRKGSVWAWLGLAVLALLVLMQGGGVLLRDRLEGRQSILAGAPADTGPAQHAAGAMATAPSRFGPEVREVPVASPPEPAPPVPAPEHAPAPAAAPEAPPPHAEAARTAPEVVPATQTAEPAPPAPQEVQKPAEATSEVSPPSAPAPEPPAPAPAAAAAPEGAYALQVGVFRSQRYRHEMEQTLDKLDVPHFRVQATRNGVGYRLAVPTPTAEAAKHVQRVLDQAGYVYHRSPKGIEVYFHLEGEAQAALEHLSKAGISAGYGKLDGPLPLWTVYAGPFSEAAARSTRSRLANQGIQALLRRRP